MNIEREYIQLASEMAEEMALERADPVALAPEPEPWPGREIVSDRNLILDRRR